LRWFAPTNEDSVVNIVVVFVIEASELVWADVSPRVYDDHYPIRIAVFSPSGEAAQVLWARIRSPGQ
jgi:hypothetical protein